MSCSATLFLCLVGITREIATKSKACGDATFALCLLPKDDRVRVLSVVQRLRHALWVWRILTGRC